MFMYTVWVHWKQGDEFRDILEKSEDVSEAFSNWAKVFSDRQKYCEEMAKELKGKNVDADADTHHIGLSGDEKVLNALAKKELINRDEIEEE